MGQNLPRTLLFTLTLACATAGFSRAQQDTTPPADIAQILKALKAMREQQTQQMKGLKAKALQQAQAAANNPTLAADMWEDAVRATQFDGAPKEGAQFREWKDKEGFVLKERECLSALRIYFSWLSLTLQRASGTPVKELLPDIITHTKEAAGDKLAMQNLEETSKKEKEMDASGKHGMTRKRVDDQTKGLHDKIANTALNGSVVVTWLKIGDMLNDAAKPIPGEIPVPGQPAPGWEMSPSNIDGIFERIILPQLRIEKDPRILEYWDMKLRTEADVASKSKLQFEIDKFNQVRRAQLQWARSQDMLAIGQKNRAIVEMFTIIKSNPVHPDSMAWMTVLEQTLVPPARTVPIPAEPATDASAIPGSESTDQPAVAPATPRPRAGGRTP